MKLLFVIQDGYEGGIWTVARNLSIELKEHGITSEILIFSKDDISQKVKSSPFQVRHKKTHFKNPLSLFQRIIYTRKCIQECAPDVIITTDMHVSISTLLSRLDLRHKMILSEHTSFIAYTLYYLRISKQKKSIAGLLYYGQLYVRYIIMYQLYRLSRMVVIPSQDNINLLAKHTFISKALWRFIPNPVVPHEEADSIDKRLGNRELSAEKVHFISMGRLNYNKGSGLLIRAFAAVRKEIKATLTILGSGNIEHYEDMATELGVGDDIIFKGHVSDVSKALSHADIFVSASRLEVAPCVHVEALHHGLAIVATDCQTGPSEILDRGKYGILVPLDNPELLAEGMLQAARGKAPSNPSQRALRAQQYSCKNSAEQYQKLIKQCAQT